MDVTLTHQELIARCRSGSREAQFELYRLYSRAMYNTALRMLQNPHDAEDVLQSVFVEVFSKLDSFRQESSIGAWIKRITINKCINFLKTKKIQFSELSSANDRADDTAHEEVDPRYTVDMIRKAIGELPEGYRIVFSLYAVEGYDHEEIAQILGITEATSKSQYSRAKARLRELLN